MKITFTDHTDDVLNLMYDRVKEGLYAVGMHLEGEAKEELENTPRRIDTGLLRNSITFALSGEAPQIKSYHGDNPSRHNQVEAVPIGRYSGTAPNDPKDAQAVYIGTNVEYAPYVELGHYTKGGGKVAAKPFLRPAAENHTTEYREIIRRVLGNA